MSDKQRCEGCGCTIKSTRRFSLAVAIQNHEKTCPRR